MNKHDRDNLMFLLANANTETFDNWLNSISEDDLEYALELLLEYRESKDKFAESISNFF